MTLDCNFEQSNYTEAARLTKAPDGGFEDSNSSKSA